jgi:peroxiredoxin
MPDPTIAAQLDDLTAGAAKHLPADVLNAFVAEQARLDAGGNPAGVAAPGTPMPDGQLLDVKGEPASLAATRQGGPAVIVFYRGAWCPYCSLTLRTYQAELMPALGARGIPLIAVSPQRPDGSLSAQEANDLTFTVLSDPDNQVTAALGILATPGEASLEAQRRIGLDIREVNADGTARLPLPTTVIVDGDGTIRWIDVHANYARRTEPEEILEAVAAHLS